MDRLRRYIITNFSLLFFSIFMPLFSIASVIFLIKLATYTSVIQLSIWEMFKLYLFVLPEIFFYTLPVTFFIAATLSLFKFSTDNEMVVLFSLGIKPNFIFRVLLKPALLLSLLLIFDFFVMFPHATVLSTNFLRYKQSEAKFNLSASEFGHKFGNWLLYIGKDNNDDSYGNVFLFNRDKDKEIIIGAKKAEVINEGGVLKLRLKTGEGYSYTADTMTQMNFDIMFINDMMHTNLREYKTTLDFWLDPYRRENKTRMFITDSLMSLFPILSLFIVMSIGIVHARHQKGRIYLYLFSALLVYYGATMGLQGILGFYTIPTVVFIWLIVTTFIYRQKVLARF